jgi:hypothetical protein
VSGARRSALNYVGSVGFVFVTGVLGILVTPVLLRLLGADTLGAARGVAGWCGLLTLLELGLTTAVQGELAQAAGDPRRQAAGLAAGLRAFVRVGVLMLVGGLVLAAGIDRLVVVRPDAVSDLRAAAVAFALVAVLLPVNALRALAEVRSEGYRMQGCYITQSLLLAGFGVGLAAAWPTITGQAAATVLATLGGCGLIVGLYHRDLRDALRVPAAEWAAAAHLLRRVRLAAAVWGLCGKVQLEGPLLLAGLVSAGLGFDVSASQRLLYALGTAVLTVGGATWAAVSTAHHAGGGAGPLVQVTRATAALACLVLVPLTVVNRPFMAAWVGAEHDLGPGYAAATAVGLFAVALLNAWALPLIGAGHLRTLGRPLAALTAVGTVGGVFAMRAGYPAAAVLALAVAPLGMVVGPLPPLLRSAMGVSRRRLFAAVGRPVAVAAVPAATLVGLLAVVPLPTWGRLTAAVAYGLVYLGLVWLVVLSADDRAAVTARLRR